RTPSQTRSPPSAILAAGAFVMQSGDVHRHPLHQERRALACRLIAARFEFVEKLLMAQQYPGWPCRPEVMREKSGIAQSVILTRERPKLRACSPTNKRAAATRTDTHSTCITPQSKPRAH